MPSIRMAVGQGVGQRHQSESRTPSCPSLVTHGRSCFYRYSNWYSTTYLDPSPDKCISSVNVSSCISKRYKLFKKTVFHYYQTPPKSLIQSNISVYILTFPQFIFRLSVYRNQRRSIMRQICLLCLFLRGFPLRFFFLAHAYRGNQVLCPIEFSTLQILLIASSR